jgi:hypothetical protein
MAGPLSVRVQAPIILHRAPVNCAYFSVSLNKC